MTDKQLHTLANIRRKASDVIVVEPTEEAGFDNQGGTARIFDPFLHIVLLLDREGKISGTEPWGNGPPHRANHTGSCPGEEESFNHYEDGAPLLRP